jgi:hypothetical protein
MAVPGIPTNLILQQANGQVFAIWDTTPTATSYSLQRSTDNVTFVTVGTPSVPQYLDTTVTSGTQYYYKVAGVNGSGTGAYTASQAITPVLSGQMTLGQIRLMSQQRADRVNSNFVTFAEWNTYINQSAFELYDLLVTLYEDYYVKAPLLIPTDGVTSQFTLPTDFYKLIGVDLGLSSGSNAWVTVSKFDFIERNRYVYPQLTATFLGVFNLRYRLVGNTLMFIPTPSAGQFLRIWYIPRLTMLLQDTDVLDGISGWTEYVIVDAAIKALEKEESDTSLLMAQKQMLMKRIEDSAMNRDAGQPDTISDVRSQSSRWGGYGTPNGDGSYGGY